MINHLRLEKQTKRGVKPVWDLVVEGKNPRRQGRFQPDGIPYIPVPCLRYRLQTASLPVALSFVRSKVDVRMLQTAEWSLMCVNGTLCLPSTECASLMMSEHMFPGI